MDILIECTISHLRGCNNHLECCRLIKIGRISLNLSKPGPSSIFQQIVWILSRFEYQKLSVQVYPQMEDLKLNAYQLLFK